MADNVVVTPGTGNTVAADEVVDATLGTVKVQYVKLMDGTLDGTGKAAISASGLKVDLGADNDVTVTGTVDLGATDNAVLDTIAAKDFATQTTLAAMNAKMVTGTDIGDVTINNASGAAAVNIQDGGNTITVDGTVTANLSATDNAVLDAIETDTTTIAGDTTSIDAKIPALGQALAAASVPVVLTAAQITTLTPPTPQTDALTDTQLRATAVPVSGTVTANLGATDNQVLDDISADTGNIDTKLGTIDADTGNIAAGFAAEGAALGSGVLLQGDDGTDRTNVLVDAAGHLQVDVLTMPAGGSGLTDTELRASPVVVDLGANNDITGTVTANLSAVDNAVLDQLELNQDAQTALLTTMDADTGAIKTALETAGGLVVNLGANNDVTVTSGTITAELSAVDNAVLDTIDAVLDTIKTDTASIVTATQLIDDTVFADDAAVTLGTSKGNVSAGVAVATDGTDPTAVSAEGDAAALRTDMNRILLVNQTHPRFWHVSADYASAQTNASVKAAPGASLSLYITDISISNGATAGNITLLDGSGGTVLLEIYPAINGGAVLSLRSPIKLTANTALCITSTTVTTHSVFVSGYIAA